MSIFVWVVFILGGGGAHCELHIFKSELKVFCHIVRLFQGSLIFSFPFSLCWEDREWILTRYEYHSLNLSAKCHDLIDPGNLIKWISLICNQVYFVFFLSNDRLSPCMTDILLHNVIIYLDLWENAMSVFNVCEFNYICFIWNSQKFFRLIWRKEYVYIYFLTFHLKQSLWKNMM